MKKCLSVILIVCMLFITGCWQTSEGNRTGTLTKFSKSGVIINTWEGSMILGGDGSSGNGSNTWQFTVEDKNVIKTLNKNHGNLITVTYKKELVTAPWRSDTNYFITKVN